MVALQIVCKLGMAMAPVRTFMRWRPAGQGSAGRARAAGRPHGGPHRGDPQPAGVAAAAQPRNGPACPLASSDLS